MSYAQNTSVSVEKSRAEIETILRKYGADRFAYMTAEEGAVIMFQYKERQIRFNLPLPRPNADVFQFRTGRGGARVKNAPDEVFKRWEQACRAKWRALKLCIQAKLEAISVNITTFEHEFLAHIVADDTGLTVADRVVPLLKKPGPFQLKW